MHKYDRNMGRLPLPEPTAWVTDQSDMLLFKYMGWTMAFRLTAEQAGALRALQTLDRAEYAYNQSAIDSRNNRIAAKAAGEV
jgi:hypothetical protein